MLVVEDEQDIAGLIKHALEREAAVDVEIAGSGDTALKSVTEDIPDLVILDLNLPVLSGVEVCRILRGRTETSKVPIIMLTARSTESDRIAGLDVGADDYITKPFSLRELAARVRAVAAAAFRRRAGRRDARLPWQAHRRRLRRRRRARGRRADSSHAARVRAASAIWWRTRTACCRGIVCSSACGDTTRRLKRDRWTCTSAGFAESSAPPDSRLKRSWAWVTGSSNSPTIRSSRSLRAVPLRAQTSCGHAPRDASR